MKRQLLKYLPRELVNIMRLFIARIITLGQKSQIWLISERGHEAKDNAYVFFLWLKKNHPEVKVRYIISKDSKDLNKLADFHDDLVYFDSFKHYKLLWTSSHLISTHIYGYRPNIILFSEIMKRYNILKNKTIVFLQHGIIKADLKALYADQTTMDLFVCGALSEYNYVSTKFGHKKGVVQYTGLCRFDNLLSSRPKKQILIMPTWRMYLNASNFKDSLYYKTLSSLLEDRELSSLAQSFGYDIIFYPHYEVQQYINLFSELNIPDNVKIAGLSYDVQQLLKDCAVLVTDYSSVYFDVAYQSKPIVYFQFDKNDFLQHHYAKGYFDEATFGPISYNKKDLLTQLKIVLDNNCILTEPYKANINSFFSMRDTNNCQRVYDAIKQIKK